MASSVVGGVRAFPDPGQRIVRTVSLAILGLSLLLGSVALLPAGAQQALTVNPTHVSIPWRNRSSAVTVTNGSDEDLQLEVAAFDWEQRPDGTMKLTPSDDLVVFPLLVTLRPQQSQLIRVGVTSSPAAVERTFRLLIKELPPAQIPGTSQASITIRTAFSVPIFVEPPKPAGHLVAIDATVKQDSLSFSVTNSGNAHTLVRKVAVTGLDARGTALFTTTLDGWYVLAQGRRDFATSVPAGKCPDVRSVKLVVTAAESSSSWTLPVESTGCR